MYVSKTDAGAVMDMSLTLKSGETQWTYCYAWICYAVVSYTFSGSVFFFGALDSDGLN